MVKPSTRRMKVSKIFPMVNLSMMKLPSLSSSEVSASPVNHLAVEVVLKAGSTERRSVLKPVTRPVKLPRLLTLSPSASVPKVPSETRGPKTVLPVNKVAPSVNLLPSVILAVLLSSSLSTPSTRKENVSLLALKVSLLSLGLKCPSLSLRCTPRIEKLRPKKLKPRR
jgi:hypothetical protein